MGAKQEAAVFEMLDAWGDGVRQADVDRIVAAFAPDAVWTLYMPGGPSIRGRDAIRAEVERQLLYVKDLHSEILNVVSSDNVVITERHDSFVRNGIPVDQFIAGAFELDSDNLITAYRDYFDLLDFAKKSGADPQALSGLEGAADEDRPIPEATAKGLAFPLHAPRTPQEQLIEDFCDAWGDGSSNRTPDVERIVSMMAPDAEWQLWVPGGPTIKGREALGQEIRRQMQYATNNKCNTVHAASSPRLVMQERSDYAVLRGNPSPHQMIAIYELDDAGLITRWREYINMADLDRKRGVAAASAHVDA
ncbi:MAG: hypothetical protein JWQ29_1661 [Phenylobacterium sp.]|nr:hypothetical protein [Phenylobacterium sp.]